MALLLVNTASAATAARGMSAPSGDPGLRSAAVLVTDSSGDTLYARNSAEVRPIASITKLMTAMVILDANLDPDEVIEITRADRDLMKLTGSRLEFGARLSRGHLLQLALMASENRAAAALGRTYPGGIDAFLAAMNNNAAALGMIDSRFSDATGLHPGNLSTARDLGQMVRAADAYPEIRRLSTAPELFVYPYRNRGPLRYGNTNRLLKNPSWEIGLSKTGYINESGRCLVMRAVIAGEPMSIVLLDSYGRLTPFGDSNRLRRWLES